MDSLVTNSSGGGEVELLGKITKPFVNLIVQIDKSVLECWSAPVCDKLNASLIKEYCTVKGSSKNLLPSDLPTPSTFMQQFEATTASFLFQLEETTTTTIPAGKEKCKYLQLKCTQKPIEIKN